MESTTRSPHELASAEEEDTKKGTLFVLVASLAILLGDSGCAKNASLQPWFDKSWVPGDAERLN